MTVYRSGIQLQQIKRRHEPAFPPHKIFERQCRVFLDPRPGGLGGFDGLFRTTI
jgi:hypothetical protein